jgi:hypothetical protein
MFGISQLGGGAARLPGVAQRDAFRQPGGREAIDRRRAEQRRRRAGDLAQHDVEPAIAADHRVARERDRIEAEAPVERAGLDRGVVHHVPLAAQLRGAELVGDVRGPVADLGQLEVRFGLDAGPEGQQRMVPVGIVELVVLRVAVVEHEGGLDRDVGVGLGESRPSA